LIGLHISFSASNGLASIYIINTSSLKKATFLQQVNLFFSFQTYYKIVCIALPYAALSIAEAVNCAVVELKMH